MSIARSRGPGADNGSEPLSEPVDDLVLDLVRWLAPGPQPYAEVMEIWRTSCPRLTVWEDAVDRGLVARRIGDDGRPLVCLTEGGRRCLGTAPNR